MVLTMACSTGKTKWAVATVAGLFVVLIALPEVLPRTVLDAPEAFIGIPSTVNLLDNLQHHNMLEQSRRGALWSINKHNLNNDGFALIVPFHVLAGRFARWTSLDAASAFSVLKVLCALALSIYLSFEVLRRERTRPAEAWVCLALILFGGGFQWLVTLSRPEEALSKPQDYLLPVEFSLFSSAFLHPHLSLAFLLLCSGLFLSSRSLRDGSVPWLGGTLVFLLVLLHPYEGILVLGIVGCAAALEVLSRPGPGLSGRLRPTLALGVAALPGLIFHYLQAYRSFVRYEPDATSYSAGEMSLFLGLLPLLALLEIHARYSETTCPALCFRERLTRFVNRLREQEDLLLLAWLMAVPLLVGLPFYFSRKFALAVNVPLGIWAGRSLVRLVSPGAGRSPAAAGASPSPPSGPEPSRSSRKTVLLATGTLLLCLSSVDFEARQLLFLSRHEMPLYLDEELQELVRIVQEGTPPDARLILWPPRWTPLVLGLTGRRVHLGWRIWVPRYEEQRARLGEVLATGRPQELRRLVEELDASHLIVPSPMSDSPSLKGLSRSLEGRYWTLLPLKT